MILVSSYEGSPITFMQGNMICVHSHTNKADRHNEEVIQYTITRIKPLWNPFIWVDRFITFIPVQATCIIRLSTLLCYTNLPRTCTLPASYTMRVREVARRAAARAPLTSSRSSMPPRRHRNLQTQFLHQTRASPLFPYQTRGSPEEPVRDLPVSNCYL